MRLALSALILSVIVWSWADAQTRGTSGSSSGTSRGSGSAVTTRSSSGTAATNSGSSTNSSSSAATAPIPGRKSYFGTLINDRGRSHDRDFGRDFNRNRHPRYPYGGYPYGYGYGYGVDYSGWYANQNQAQSQEYMAQNERLEQSYQDDMKRQHELERQLADQRAADEASARNASASSSNTPTPTERELPPTVLIYKDHHQVEVRNYAIAGNMIYEFNPHWTRKIALSDLDIPATIAANNERGIEFTVPSKAKQQQD